MFSKKQKRLAAIIVGIASIGLVVSSIGGSLYYLLAGAH